MLFINLHSMVSTNIYDHSSLKYPLPDETFVILVDESDNEIGVMEKMEAHRKALLHRAEPYLFLLSIRRAIGFCSEGLSLNIIPTDYGPTPVAVIQIPVNHHSKQPTDD